MTIHRFTVNIPNPTAEMVSVQLRLKAAKHLDFDWPPGDFPHRALKVKDAGIALDVCAKKGKRDLRLKLEPFTSMDVQVIINTPRTTKPGAAGFHLIDRRNGMDVGGVFLVCTNPELVTPLPQIILPPNPCPATLARDLYVIWPGDHPIDPAIKNPMGTGDTLELVASITNPTDQPLQDTQVYLEHMGSSNVEFAPGTWNVGTLEPGDVFYATWQVRILEWRLASYETSIVVVSQNRDPVRLNGKISLAPRDVPIELGLAP